MATTKPRATVKVGTRTYKHDSCSSTKAGAKARAKKLRASGKVATVRGNCVYSAAAKRRTTKKK